MKHLKEYVVDYAVQIPAFAFVVIALIRLALSVSLLAAIFKII